MRDIGSVVKMRVAWRIRTKPLVLLQIQRHCEAAEKVRAVGNLDRELRI